MWRTPFICCTFYTRSQLLCHLSLSPFLFTSLNTDAVACVGGVANFHREPRWVLKAFRPRLLPATCHMPPATWSMSLQRLYVVHVSGRGLYVGLIGFADANEESNF